MWDLWLVLVVGAGIAYLLLRARETFVVKYGNPFDNEDIISLDINAKGTRLFGTTPDTCPSNKSDLQDGLCYEQCVPGYHGVGPVCWADTINIGVGKPVGLEPCPAGWVNDGLTCREPIRCEPIKCASGLEFFTKGCTGGGCSGGRLKGRLDSGGVCDYPSNRGELPDWLVDKRDPKNFVATHPDRVDGLCYTPCPKDKPNRVPGMPYLCFKRRDPSTGVSYERGAGSVPPIFKIGE